MQHGARRGALTCMEQNLGPHMEQKWAVLAGSCGRVASWNSRAVTGSSDRLNWSYLQRRHPMSVQIILLSMQIADNSKTIYQCLHTARCSGMTGWGGASSGGRGAHQRNSNRALDRALSHSWA